MLILSGIALLSVWNSIKEADEQKGIAKQNSAALTEIIKSQEIVVKTSREMVKISHEQAKAAQNQANRLDKQLKSQSNQVSNLQMLIGPDLQLSCVLNLDVKENNLFELEKMVLEDKEYSENLKINNGKLLGTPIYKDSIVYNSKSLLKCLTTMNIYLDFRDSKSNVMLMQAKARIDDAPIAEQAVIKFEKQNNNTSNSRKVAYSVKDAYTYTMYVGYNYPKRQFIINIQDIPMSPLAGSGNTSLYGLYNSNVYLGISQFQCAINGQSPLRMQCESMEIKAANGLKLYLVGFENTSPLSYNQSFKKTLNKENIWK